MLTQAELHQYLNYDPQTGIFTWKVKLSDKINIGQKTGCKNNRGYLLIKINKKLYRAHRLAWLYVYGYFPKFTIDHINRIKTDNRIENLRDVTIQENLKNKPNKRIQL